MPEQCIIGEENFFVRGCLEVPIIGTADFFSWGVWVSLSEGDFERMSEMWQVVGRESEPAYHGSLATDLPFYPDTASLNVALHTRPIGQRPLVEVESADHPLALEQRAGITTERARRLAEMLEHQTPVPSTPHSPEPKRLPWWRFFWSRSAPKKPE
jgi:hypothetical protein